MLKIVWPCTQSVLRQVCRNSCRLFHVAPLAMVIHVAIEVLTSRCTLLALSNTSVPSTFTSETLRDQDDFANCEGYF
jgi:hypothetical protein